MHRVKIGWVAAWAACMVVAGGGCAKDADRASGASASAAPAATAAAPAGSSRDDGMEPSAASAAASASGGERDERGEHGAARAKKGGKDGQGDGLAGFARGGVAGGGALGLNAAAAPAKEAERSEKRAAVATAQASAIDPNGRFATTYRPGAGHLAAFDSAVARGIVPAAEREVVSDIGAHYAPTFITPAGHALGIQSDFERSKLQPGGGPFHLRVALRSTADKPAGRPHLSVHLVLDISGSMQGDSITHARDAARALVDKLAPTDDFSFVTFSNDADVRVPDGPVGARREAIKKVIADVKETGGTNIGKGLSLGYAQAKTKGIPDDAVKVVLLLSDGRANVGITDPQRLSKLALDAFQDGIQTSSFGLGADYDGPLMSAIASEGAGGYYYLRDAAQIAPALTTEIDKRLDPVATAVEVRVRLKKGVELLKVYGSQRLTEVEAARVRQQEVASDAQAQKRDKIEKDRQDDTKGGMRFFIPAFARDDAHALLFQLRAPAGVGKLPVGIVELKYKDRVSKKNQSEEFPLVLAYADSDAKSGASINPSVARTVQGFAAGESLADAANRIAHGDRAGAVAALTEREAILRTAAKTLDEPLFLKDADRLARLAGHAKTETGLGEPLVLSMMLETAGYVHMR